LTNNAIYHLVNAILEHTMGARVNNIEVVTDYADGRSFIRLHRDIVLPKNICDAVRQLLDAGQWEQAKMTALEYAPANSQEELILFFDSAAENDASTADDDRVDWLTKKLSLTGLR
jgi:hypothetical protein